MAAGHAALQRVQTVALPDALLEDALRIVLRPCRHHKQRMAPLIENVVNLHIGQIRVFHLPLPRIQLENLVKLSQEDVHNGHLEVIPNEQHFRDVHVLLELPGVVSDVGEFWLHELDVLLGEEADGGVEVLGAGGSGALGVVGEEVADEDGHVAIGRVLEPHPHETVSLEQCETHLGCLPLQIIEYHPHLQRRKQVFLQPQHVVVVLSLASRPDHLLEVLHLIDVIDHPADLLQFLHAVEDVQALEDVVLIQFVEDLKEDILVGSDDGLGDLIVAVEEPPCDLDYVIKGILVPFEEGQCEGRESVVKGQPVVADHDPLPAIQDGLLLDESLDDVEVAALPVSLVVFGHLGQHEHEKGRVLLEGHLSAILRDGVVDPADIRAYEALLLAEPVDEQLDGLVALSESTQHVVEVAVVDLELVLEVVLELIYHHVPGGFLHLLEDLVHVVVVLGLLVLVAVVVCVVEKDQLELLPRTVQLTVLQFQFMSARDALRVHVGTWTPLKAVGMGLQIDMVLLVLLHDQVPQVILVIDDLEDLSALGEDEVSAVISRNGL